MLSRKPPGWRDDANEDNEDILAAAAPRQTVPTQQANGIDIYHEEQGSGEPLVLIGGLATDISQMEGMIHDLAQRCRVIAFDNRGAGRSDKPDSPYTIDAMAEDAYLLLKAIGIQSTHVLGISMGGRIAISLSLAHPEMVKSLILASTSARTASHGGLSWKLSNVLIRIPAVRAIGTKYPQPYYAYVRQRGASGNYDATGRLGEILTPTIILHGRKDSVVPFELAEEMQRGIAGSKLLPFDSGHLFPFRKQREFVDSVLGFLESQRGSPGAQSDNGLYGD